MVMQVEFVSPEDILYSGEGTQVTARTRGGGEIAFLTGHEPFIGSLVPCEVRVSEASGDVKRFAVRGGFVSVNGAKVTVLSDAAVPAADVDASAAQADLAEAEAALESDPTDAEARMNVQWANARLAAISTGSGHSADH